MHIKEPIAIFYLHPITQGKYALYQIRHHGEFAIAGLRRTDDGPWEVDQIKGSKNAEPSETMASHVAEWFWSIPTESQHSKNSQSLGNRGLIQP